ncbi:hypothetical protein FLA_2152 [Filimonas lacunae]|nr:hypothetical protein FLA_2152 [Filimonas lacunae]
MLINFGSWQLKPGNNINDTFPFSCKATGDVSIRYIYRGNSSTHLYTTLTP